jgi:glyoxylase-like metal-dependent hydrolase (beta-lactamase superfamily II)
MSLIRPSRRALLKASAFGAAALGCGLPSPAFARQQRFTVGDIKVTVVSDGALSLPIDFVLPQTPRDETNALFRANGLDPERLQSQVNVVVVETPADLILIDAGAGTDFMQGLGQFPDALQAAGYDANKVTKVVFTHLHADHLWGAIDDFESPRFASADHVVTATELDFWRATDVTRKVPEAFVPMLKFIDAQVKTAKPGDTVAPGLTLIDTAGHTPGHVSVLIESGRERLLVGGDLANQSLVSFARPDWRWGSDMDAARAAASRRRLMDMLSSERIPLVGTHLPWPGLGRVDKDGSAYRFVQG